MTTDEQYMLHQYRAGQANVTSRPGAVNFALLHAIIPYLAAGFAWLMWLFFLLLPTVFNFDYAGVFPALSNYAYVLMGLTLCLAATTAAWVAHGVRAIAFTFAVLLLSYWIY